MEESDNLVEMCNNALEKMNNVENAAPPQMRYHLPFGSSMSSKDRLRKRRLEKLKDKKANKKALKRQILNGQDLYGWLDSGTTSNFIAHQDKKHFKPTGIKSNKQVKFQTGRLC